MSSTFQPVTQRRRTIWVAIAALVAVTAAGAWLLLKPAAVPTPPPAVAATPGGSLEFGLVEFRFPPFDPRGPQPMTTFHAPHLPPVSITRLARLTEPLAGVYRTPDGGGLVAMRLARHDPFAPPGQGLAPLGDLPTTATPGNRDVRFTIPLKLLQAGKAYKVFAAMTDGTDAEVLYFTVANV